MRTRICSLACSKPLAAVSALAVPASTSDFSVSVPVRTPSVKASVKVSVKAVVEPPAETHVEPEETPKPRASPEKKVVKRDLHSRPSLVSVLQSRMEAIANEKARRAELNVPMADPSDI